MMADLVAALRMKPATTLKSKDGGAPRQVLEALDAVKAYGVDISSLDDGVVEKHLMCKTAT